MSATPALIAIRFSNIPYIISPSLKSLRVASQLLSGARKLGWAAGNVPCFHPHHNTRYIKKVRVGYS